MSTRRSPALAISLAAALLCMSAPARIAAAPAAFDPVSDAAAIVKATDWSRAETLTIEMSEHGYQPNALVLKALRPYRLVLRNVGEKDHYYSAPEFFRSVATRKFQVPGGGEVKAPYFTAIEVYRNGTGELFIVPVRTGQFPVYCTIDDHREQGMEGTISVE